MDKDEEKIKVEINTGDNSEDTEKKEDSEATDKINEEDKKEDEASEIEKLKAEIELLKKSNLEASTNFMNETDKKAFDSLDISIEDKAKMIDFLKNYNKQIPDFEGANSEIIKDEKNAPSEKPKTENEEILNNALSKFKKL